MKTEFSIFVLVPFLFFFASCANSGGNGSNSADQTTNTLAQQSGITQAKIGERDGKEVLEFTLTNRSGMLVKLISYGATVTHIFVPDSRGALGDVVLGFDSYEEYLQDGNPFFGCVVGRYANRIANGRFSLEGKQYQLPTNNNGHTLHGGNRGFDKMVWDASVLPGDTGVKFSYLSRDGEEGFPGNLQAEVVYSLTNNNELRIEYKATTDKPTPVNLTNHSYFNLSGGQDSTILGHGLMIDADRFTEVDKDLIPTGDLMPVRGTSMDFNTPKSIGTDIETVAGGFDHNWVLNKRGGGLQMAASLYHPSTGRYMEVFTTHPGVQFYSGNFLNGTLKGKGGVRYSKHAGLCLETQHFPDSPNQPSFPPAILRPGETYQHSTVFRFGVKG